MQTNQNMDLAYQRLDELCSFATIYETWQAK